MEMCIRQGPAGIRDKSEENMEQIRIINSTEKQYLNFWLHRDHYIFQTVGIKIC